MRLVLVIAAAILGYCYYRGQAVKVQKAAVKEDVNRWEGEGGNVPTVATPSPAPAPQSSYPAGESVTRH